jgi:hypothetical protein
MNPMKGAMREPERTIMKYSFMSGLLIGDMQVTEEKREDQDSGQANPKDVQLRDIKVVFVDFGLQDIFNRADFFDQA